MHAVLPADGDERPLCCGRTFLSVGAVHEARREMERTLAALTPYVERGMPVIGLEPSCLLGFRDEMPALLRSEAAKALAGKAVLFEEFIASEYLRAGSICRSARCRRRRCCTATAIKRRSMSWARWNQRSGWSRNLRSKPSSSSCCGMAGAFGYAADTIDVSLKMAELSLLPAVRKAATGTLIVADGTSCRHQIHDGSGREALHVARVVAMSVAAAPPRPAA